MTIYLRPPELAEKLKVIAFLEGLPVMDLFNEAVSALVAKREKKHKAALTSVMKARKKA